ncbi:MAG: GNAT family N-acetyltransferase [candidate division Zixibacteria bacterium]
MITIRKYQKKDSVAVGKLIADTFLKYNLSYASPEEQQKLLGPFRNARSKSQSHQDEIAKLISAPMVFVAVQDKKKIVGVLRGSKEKMRSLFVLGNSHRNGFGRKLVMRFEKECVSQNSQVIKLMATVYAIPFYQKMGYKKTTGIRKMNCLDGTGLPYQPMKKII